jgi:hypothetical protein
LIIYNVVINPKYSRHINEPKRISYKIPPPSLCLSLTGKRLPKGGIPPSLAKRGKGRFSENYV